MAQDFDRKVTGYNIFKLLSGWFIPGLQNPVVLNLAAGPGEILGIIVLKNYGTDANFHTDANIKIMIDGSQYVWSAWSALLTCNLAYDFFGTIASNHISPLAPFASSDLRVKIPYDQTAQVTFTGGANTNGQVMIYYRIGG